MTIDIVEIDIGVVVGDHSNISIDIFVDIYFGVVEIVVDDIDIIDEVVSDADFEVMVGFVVIDLNLVQGCHYT